MSLEFKPAVRSGIKPLIGLFGLSGGGKTLSALLLGRGIVGDGKLALADTENERGSVFVDMVPGGYFALNMVPPFSPKSFIDVIDAAESSGMDALVVDSLSHEWMGEGGYLDMKEAVITKMAGDDWSKRDRCALAAAARCKPEHYRLVTRILRSKMAMILCFRGKEKVKLEKSGGKTNIVADDFASPIQDSELIFEMLIAGEVYAKEAEGGYFRCTKYTHPDIRKIIPKENQQLTIEHGKLIAQWCNTGAVEQKQSPPQPDERKRLITAILDAGKAAQVGDQKALKDCLIAHGKLQNGETVSTLPEDRLREILEWLQTMKAAA